LMSYVRDENHNNFRNSQAKEIVGLKSQLSWVFYELLFKWTIAANHVKKNLIKYSIFG
jgi:hypothetical protein